MKNWIEIGRMDELAGMDTPAHRIDARAKGIASIIFIIVVMSFPRYEISALAPFFIFPLVIASIGRIPFGFIFWKILLAAPFAIAIGIFNPFFDRDPVITVGSFAVSGGWMSFISIMLRFALTVGAALVMVACTGMYRLGEGLERLGLPRVFVVQLLFLYRYLFVIADEGLRMTRSMALRSLNPAPANLRVYGSLVGHLMLRSMARAERIYHCMVARGFSGEIRLARQTSFKAADWAFLLGWTAFFITARRWNLSEALGRLVTGAGS